jgi:uncharacterized protein YndB with AHSA1/START domain
MAKTIEQTVELPASGASLYRTYVDPALHGAMTGAPVEIGEEPGAEFLAFNGMLSGRVLHTVPDRMVVQTWRANQWDPDELDSVLTLHFVDTGAGSARIELVHVGVAPSDIQGVTDGWSSYYWVPWREYIESV